MMDSIPTGWLSLTPGMYSVPFIMHNNKPGSTCCDTKHGGTLVMDREPLFFGLSKKYQVWLCVKFRSSQGGELEVFLWIQRSIW